MTRNVRPGAAARTVTGSTAGPPGGLVEQFHAGATVSQLAEQQGEST
jgi:hypothetical protein